MDLDFKILQLPKSRPMNLPDEEEFHNESSKVYSKAKPDERRLAVNLPADLHKALKIRTYSEGKTVRDVIVNLLEIYLDP